MVFSYGQVNKVVQQPLATEYFTTELYNAISTSKSSVVTVPLFHLSNVVTLLSTMWAGNAERQTYGLNVPMVMNRNTTVHIKGQARYVLRNMSNEPITLRAYYVKARNNVPIYNGNGSIYNLLGEGFGDKANLGTVTASNLFMTNWMFTPFDSTTFTRYFKITRVRKFKLKETQSKELYIKKSTTIKPASLFNIESLAPAGWNTQPLEWDYIKAARFILFRMEGNPAIPTGQTTYQTQISTTTPCIAMETIMTYQSQLIFVPGQASGNGQSAGFSASEGQIMADDDYKVKTEVNA